MCIRDRLTADRVAGFLGDSALDLALDTIPTEVVTGFEEGEGAAQIAKDAAGNICLLYTSRCV